MRRSLRSADACKLEGSFLCRWLSQSDAVCLHAKLRIMLIYNICYFHEYVQVLNIFTLNRMQTIGALQHACWRLRIFHLEL